MYVLNERQSSIVMDLIETNNPITAKDLAFKYNVSIRTIRYDIEIVEVWMEEENLNFIKKPRVGMWMDIVDKEKEAIKYKLKGVDPYVKSLSKDERKKVIISELLKVPSYVTGEYLCEKIGVSKTTLLEDLNEIRDKLKPKEIFIEGKPGLGYVIKGNEENIRELISQILLLDLDRFQLVDMLNKEETLDGISITDLQEGLNLADNINVQDIKYAIKMSKKIYDFWIPDSSYISLIIHIAIAVDRLLNDQEISLPAEKIKLIQTYKEYVLAKEIAFNLERIYHIKIPEAEVANITFHLISANLKLSYLHSENIYDVKNNLFFAVDKMIDYLKAKLELPEESFDSLRADILSHLKLTLKKMELDIPNTNPLLDQIKEGYGGYYALAEDIAFIFMETTGVNLTEDEIGYITLHIAAYGELHKEELTKKVLLVCTTGQGLAKILGTKLRRKVPELIIEDTVSIFDLEDGNIPLTGIDFIISTFPIPNMSIPVVEVSPIITEQDITRIRSYIYKEDYRSLSLAFNENTYMLDSLMNVICKHGDIRDQYKLRDELGYVLEFIINNTFKGNISNEFSLNKMTEDIALIMVDVGQMIEDLKEYLDDEEGYLQTWGLAIHIVMSIPRWRVIREHNEFKNKFNINGMPKEQQKIYRIVFQYMEKISIEHNFSISDSEIMAIVRYFV